MTNFYGLQMAKIRTSNPPLLPDVADVGGRVRCFNEKIFLNGQAVNDTIEIAKLPKGSRIHYGILNADTNLGSATLAIGIAGNSTKYRSALTLPSSNTPIFFGTTSAVGEGLLTEEIVLLTIGGATLPSMGLLRAQIFYTID
ncbi:MAG: hypothetical protein K1X44_07475 [Alphaproteobacteria bacterium]|nr:hypothetical protein [Alphaproteobacteria bacterium]